jgi:hypothetical protein
MMGLTEIQELELQFVVRRENDVEFVYELDSWLLPGGLGGSRQRLSTK